MKKEFFLTLVILTFAVMPIFACQSKVQQDKEFLEQLPPPFEEEDVWALSGDLKTRDYGIIFYNLNDSNEEVHFKKTTDVFNFCKEIYCSNNPFAEKLTKKYFIDFTYIECSP